MSVGTDRNIQCKIHNATSIQHVEAKNAKYLMPHSTRNLFFHKCAADGSRLPRFFCPIRKPNQAELNSRASCLFHATHAITHLVRNVFFTPPHPSPTARALEQRSECLGNAYPKNSLSTGVRFLAFRTLFTPFVEAFGGRRCLHPPSVAACWKAPYGGSTLAHVASSLGA